MNIAQEQVNSLKKTSRFILLGIFAQGSLFAFWGTKYFMSSPEAALAPIWPSVVFSVMALGCFLYGFRFYQNYSLVRKTELMQQDLKKRKDSLLLIVVIHLLLIETICILGIILAIFLQNVEVVYPFYAFFLVGLAMSYPKEEWFQPFFPRGES